MPASSLQGGELAAVCDLGTRVSAASRSFAVALTACTTPGAGKPGFDLPEDEIEVGVGIHDEPGRSREKIRSAKDIAATMVEAILTMAGASLTICQADQAVAGAVGRTGVNTPALRWAT